MKVRDLLVLSGSKARLAAFDAAQAGDSAGLHGVAGTMNFVQYLIGGVIEGSFQAADGAEGISYSATVWGPTVGCGVVKGTGAFVRPLPELFCQATVYLASDAKVLEIAWFDENDLYMGSFAGACEGLSAGAQVAVGAFTRPASAVS